MSYLYEVGEFVYLRPFEDLVADGLVDDWDGLPPGDVEAMREYYGASTPFKVIDRGCGGSGRRRYRLRVTSSESWWFNEFAISPTPPNASSDGADVVTVQHGYTEGDRLVLSRDADKYLDFYTETGTDLFWAFGAICEVQHSSRRKDDSVLVRLSGENCEYERPWWAPLSLVEGPVPDGYEPPPEEDRPCMRECEKCGSMFVGTRSVAPEDAYLCPNCRKREYITPYHRWSPPLKFWKTPSRDNDGLYLGAEIEIALGGELDSVARDVVRMMNPDGDWFMHCSHDGSLDNGMELITMPATLKYHRAIKSRYEDLFRFLTAKGYRAHNTSCCGLHVHFSRAFFGDREEENISKLLYVTERFWDELVVFSRRDYRSLEHYAKKMGCSADAFLERWNKTNRHDGHYYAVNITNSNTIELRMFRGTLNLETYMATLEFVEKLVRTVKAKTPEELQSMNFEDFLTPNAKTYYAARKAIAKWDAEGKEDAAADGATVRRISLADLSF